MVVVVKRLVNMHMASISSALCDHRRQHYSGTYIYDLCKGEWLMQCVF